ncbi:MAG: DUF4416 family protein [Candidatus Omnitrophica bacterium]|nr:DUF4416 family protein [Candidatus Omnitrophota bacterium]
MGIPFKPQKVKLFFGFISKDEVLFLQTERILFKKFGPIDFMSRMIPFDYTSYYNEELGDGLKRKFVSTKRLIAPEKLADIKLFTNKIENKFSFHNKRRINIDPGYVSGGKLVLATTKDYSHRIYLGKGIFAEVTLFYQNGSFHPLQWTYPDYRTKDYIEIFNHLYKTYIERTKV